MNHEAAPGGSASRRSSSHAAPQRSRRLHHASRARRRANLPPGRSAAVMRKVRAGLAKKLSFFTDLMTHLDMIVYAELCALYYMDCSFFRLVIRAVAQSLFLSPKSEDFFLITPAHKPHVVAVFLPNSLCLLLHLFTALPQASEASRGYLHGGILIDFVGQRAPASRLGLLALDLLVLLVQCLMLAVHTEREKLRKLVVPMKGTPIASTSLFADTVATTAPANAAVTPIPVPPRSAEALAVDTVRALEAAERGEVRHAAASAAAREVAEGIEMQLLSGVAAPQAGRRSRSSENTTEESEDSHPLRADLDSDGPRSLSAEQAADRVLNLLASGSLISDFYVVSAVREASRNYQGVAAQSLQTIGLATTLARLAAQRGARQQNTAQ